MQFAKAQKETIIREKDNPAMYSRAHKIIIKFRIIKTRICGRI